MTREELQLKAVGLLETNKRLICRWATGTGKSKVALNFLKAHPGVPTLILVPEQNNIQNWKDEFEKFNVPMYGVDIACYASAHKYEGTDWTLLVLDEAPHTNTEKKIGILSSISADYVLALGAVISGEEEMTLTKLFGNFKISTVTLDMAIRMEALPEPQVRIIHMTMSPENRRLYDNLSAAVTKAVQAYEKQRKPYLELMMKKAGNERKRFLGALKEDALRRICQKLNEQNRRFICFCSSIKQAEELGGDHAFTSKSRKDIIDRFNNHEIDSLYVVGKLIEGQNLKDIDCGIIGQIGGSQRITVQEVGRVMRSQNPVIFVPIFDDTKDDGFLWSLIGSISNKYIKHYKF